MDSNCLVCTSNYLRGSIRKRLIVCCDGTFSGVDKGTDQYSSNVARLSRTISKVGITTDGNKIPQVVYYQSGVGTGALTVVNKARQGAVGESLAEKVCEAYNYLANNWGPGDEIFIFGFSRGAYTARSLAGFICEVGLLTPLMLDHFYEIYEAYKNRGGKPLAETAWAKTTLTAGELGTVPPRKGDSKRDMGTRMDFLRRSSHHHVKIKVVGVWDTVGSLGYTNWFGQAGADSSFHSTRLSPKIENAFHALAVDETRGNFPPTLWYLDSCCMGEDNKPKVNLKQCWFPGYHSDVGGHSASNIDTNSVDEIAFAWMCDQLFGLLQLSGTALQKYILFRIGDLNLDTQNKNIRDLKAAWSTIKWSDGTLEDTNGWTDWWWIPSLISTRSASYKRIPGETPASEVVDGKKKDIDYMWFNEEVHPSVRHRMNTKDLSYMPEGLSKANGWRYVEASGDRQAHWVKNSNGKEIVLNEYIIPKLSTPFQSGSGYDFWQGSLERTFAPKDVLAAQDLYA
ncbi:peptidoglycan binding domain-containing protein [Xylaria bambusicola]|uniref:peptidoglycan binding domain-containing protein n=1 Tax=Xylaria bambusicola TaxID=326684 RepID=UPI0020075FAC|nr:peptidoglycan binding domain-containing protein [Xylaria bambusicola]KAI0502742.1 peptidoglycan binding domain-containing protein [Xylaria bambusicola]